MKILNKAFGTTEKGFADLPRKISGTQIARLLVGKKMGCAYCFPHGYETINNKWKKLQRSWKKYRKTQYKF